MKNWFDELTVTRKREDISLLIKRLMREYNKDTSDLPDILLPTLEGKKLLIVYYSAVDVFAQTGKIVDHTPPEDEEDEEEDEEDEFGEPDEDENLEEGEIPSGFREVQENESMDDSGETESPAKDLQTEEAASAVESVNVSLKPSHENVKGSGSFVEQNMTDVARPDLSEVQKQNSSATMLYLKTKRIIRHKVNEGGDIKKLKTNE